MRKTSFETLGTADLVQMHNAEWHDVLIGLQVETLDADADDDDQPLADATSSALPYRAAMRRYEDHVHGCTGCSDTPVWDIGCQAGNTLAKAAADAMSAQEEQAGQN
jgi:hypothetical protein